MPHNNHKHNLKPPVFVVGNPRSGTTLLYHMLLSSGDFAIYRAETHIFNLLPPSFGDLKSKKNRLKLIDFWLNSVFFKISTLEALPWKKEAINYCTNYAKFLEFFMESIAVSQKANRWAECTPMHLLHMNPIKKGIPGAKFVHIIRDPRDVALSLTKLGWSRPIPLFLSNELYSAVLRWKWMVEKGRQIGQRLGKDYIEIFFEELINKPNDVLDKLGIFIDHDLNYDRILEKGIGSVSKPNTAFKGEKSLNPLNRWRSSLNESTITEIEMFIGDELNKFGYALSNNINLNRPKIKQKSLGILISLYLDIKHLTKYHTPLGRFGETPYQFNEKMKKIFYKVF